MKTVASVCAGIALAASIVAVNLRLELRKEREVTAALQGSPTAVLPPVDHPAAPRSDITQSATVAAATIAVTPIREQSKDPEYRKLQLAQLRRTVERFYPRLAQELGLSEKEADRLFDLLAENQLARMADDSLPIAPGGQIDQQEARRKQEAFDRAQEESIQTLLGGKYAQWQSYQQSGPARTQVTAMITQLAQAGGSLSAEQVKGLTTALIAERQRQIQEEMLIPRAPPGSPEDPAYRAQLIEESLKRTEENNRRILVVATPYIDATQLTVLRKQMERQTSASRQMLRTQKESERQPARPSQ